METHCPHAVVAVVTGHDLGFLYSLSNKCMLGSKLIFAMKPRQLLDFARVDLKTNTPTVCLNSD